MEMQAVVQHTARPDIDQPGVIRCEEDISIQQGRDDAATDVFPRTALVRYKARFRKVQSTCEQRPPREVGILLMYQSRQSESSSERYTPKRTETAYLEMTFGVEKKVFRLEITMGDALAMKVGDSANDLLETALHFAW